MSGRYAQAATLLNFSSRAGRPKNPRVSDLGRYIRGIESRSVDDLDLAPVSPEYPKPDVTAVRGDRKERVVDR